MPARDIDIARLLDGPEGQYSERKSLYEGLPHAKRPRDRKEVRNDVARCVAAFANSDGGVLILGAEDDGTATGHSYPDRAVAEILMVPERRLSPPQSRGERVAFRGIELLVFQVAPAGAPVMVQGNGYPCRVGDENIAFEAHKISAWKEQGIVESWEARRSELSLDDLDSDQIRLAMRRSEFVGDDLDKYLARRRLADVRGPSLSLRRAAELVFARDPHRIDHPNAGVRIFRVVGTERRFGIHHNVQELPRIEGNLPTVLQAVFQTVQGLLRRPRRLRGLRFEEMPEYPTLAWQEAIVNALAHRDYGVPSRCVEVWFYDDRMEVTNPGGLMTGVSLAGILGRERVHASRNPRLSRALVDLGFMREQGEGIPRMFAEMEVQFLAPPEFAESEGGFSVTLRNAPAISPADAEWVASLEGEQLNDQQIRAMLLARVRGNVTNSALRDATGLDTLQASLELRALRDRSLLQMQGSGSAAFYTLGARADRPLPDRPALTSDRQDLAPDRQNLERPSGSDRQDLAPDRQDLERANRSDRQELAPDRQELAPDRQDLERPNGSDRQDLAPGTWEGGLLPQLPSDLFDAVHRLGPRARREELRDVIERLCAWRPMTATELGAALGIRADNLTRRHLSQMVESGRLQRTHPENPNHPAQAYRARQIALPPSPAPSGSR